MRKEPLPLRQALHRLLMHSQSLLTHKVAQLRLPSFSSELKLGKTGAVAYHRMWLIPG
jgi:hypothetical protein